VALLLSTARAQRCDGWPAAGLAVFSSFPYEVRRRCRRPGSARRVSASCSRPVMASAACMPVSSGRGLRPAVGCLDRGDEGVRRARQAGCRGATVRGRPLTVLQGSLSRSRRIGASSLTAAGCVAARSAARSAAWLADVPRPGEDRAQGRAAPALDRRSPLTHHAGGKNLGVALRVCPCSRASETGPARRGPGAIGHCPPR